MKSALTQTYTNLEVIIINDFSSDETAQILASVTDARVRVLTNSVCSGAAESRNRGIQSSRGRYIAFLDGDDAWHPDKLERQVAFFRTSRDSCGMVYTGYECVSGYARCSYEKVFAREIKNRNELFVTNCIGVLSSVMVERRVFESVGFFDTTLMSCQDWDLYIRISALFTVKNIPDILCVYSDQYNRERISCQKKGVLQGQRTLQRTYQNEIARLSAREKGERMHYVARRFILAGAYVCGMALSFKAMFYFKQYDKGAWSLVLIGKRVCESLWLWLSRPVPE
jgi:glycosyltransferase involved in cell wall biosynthesis